ncbi:hypothetical protein LP417_28260 [Polaromonas sp. P1-6]|nr:hypothetical protein LP417_28260 [Polaromonas sp. P1-6]
MLFAAMAVASYAVGVAVGRAQSKEAFAPVLASVQADLGLNHVLRLRELESDLARGCSSEALAKVRFDSHTQMLVLSSLYKEHKGTWVVEGIAKRDPTMPSQLEQFRKMHDSWTEPKCSK